jgi:hypothetical protein
MVAEKLLIQRSDLRGRVDWIVTPLKDDTDVDFIVALHRLGLLSEDERLQFVEVVRRSAVKDADDSFIEVPEIAAMLTPREHSDILTEVHDAWFSDIPAFVAQLSKDWDSNYSPDDYFDNFRSAARTFAAELAGDIDERKVNATLEQSIKNAIDRLLPAYEDTPTSSTPLPQSAATSDSLEELFRDIDE